MPSGERFFPSTMTSVHGQRIAIIGAGLAGVAAARELTRRGASVTMFEKSRGLGGRCASKRWEGHVIDHGAQYFTIRDDRFRSAVTAACGDRLQCLSAPVVTAQGEVVPDSGGRWFHREGNSRLARDLLGDGEVRLESLVPDARALLRSGGGEFDRVLSTAPWPQTARLFGMASGNGYIPCLAVLLACRAEWAGRSREVYAIRDPSGPLAWSACENHKPGRIAAGFTVIVAHLSEAFSREHLDRPPEEIPGLVQDLVEERWGLPAGARAAVAGHRWKFARVDDRIPIPDLPPGCHFTGDAVRGSRVEDAWLAGFEFGSQVSLS